MKKTISLLLIVLTVASLLGGCGSSGTEPAIKTDVAKPLTMAEIDAIPVVSPDMTVDELREICVTFMRYQNAIVWTPSKKFTYYNGDKFNSYNAGKVLGGLPYITMSSGSLYNIMHFYDERNGVLDIDAIEALKQPWEKVVTNQCSGAVFWGWSRVCNSVKAYYTAQMLEMYGYIPLPLGTHYLDPTLPSFSFPELMDTRETLKEFDEQKLYEGYAVLQPADGLVHYFGSAGGHVYMCSSKPTIVYKKDGTIDGEKSYITILDQSGGKNTYTQSNGVKVDGFGGIDDKRTFKKLYESGYLPFTLPEFVGQDPIEKSEVTTNHKKETMSYDDLSAMNVSSNYAISYITTTVKNSKGKELYSQHLYSCDVGVYELKPFNNVIHDAAKLRELANGKNTIEITVRIGTGEVLTAYTGKLVK